MRDCCITKKNIDKGNKTLNKAFLKKKTKTNTTVQMRQTTFLSFILSRNSYPTESLNCTG